METTSYQRSTEVAWGVHGFVGSDISKIGLDDCHKPFAKRKTTAVLGRVNLRINPAERFVSRWYSKSVAACSRWTSTDFASIYKEEVEKAVFKNGLRARFLVKWFVIIEFKIKRCKKWWARKLPSAANKKPCLPTVTFDKFGFASWHKILILHSQSLGSWGSRDLLLLFGQVIITDIYIKLSGKHSPYVQLSSSNRHAELRSSPITGKRNWKQYKFK